MFTFNRYLQYILHKHLIYSVIRKAKISLYDIIINAFRDVWSSILSCGHHMYLLKNGPIIIKI
jgi:hypothetical protein